ncbi:1-aminocyclopropane-1-carboxylate deaminase/D-cysteine desulfhydrase [Croceimicrobium hydrocarbonivorans]|uniref:Pyridoxal-phosphate dependent enzyme n=1 Tax=Croceimicrobium hydrocarbonivorans TaxID=2761580 RepID=A0A7H0VHZ8_9FLAO|nr:pyridoxal-phosphate dependent enzyme [Croceimicrobium hydrocarbonivorans]QNR25346.1 pyridoxal-phosphate dependent enzyme [Croceimicrobium hydrocarbonivorans]
MELSINTLNSKEEFLLNHHGVDVFLKRDDQIHPEISGNKWRKLKYHLEKFYLGDYRQILSFGGAFSNHLAALAALGKLAEIPTYAMVRGEEAGDSPTLEYCSAQGMEWEAISRKDYSLKENPEFLEALQELRPGLYILPEGGKGVPALKGCAEIIDELEGTYDCIALAAGTGTTAAGLLAHPKAPKIRVYAALKGGSFLKPAIAQYLQEYQSEYGLAPIPRDLLIRKLDLVTDYHFGGFAKINQELVQFMNETYRKYQLKLDPVYTSKLLFGLLKDIEAGHFKAGSRVLVLHSGGLQGIAGMNRRLAKKSEELIAYD